MICPVHIRWMIRLDMDAVLQIEQSSFEFNWTEEDFLQYLRQSHCIGMVAEHNETVVGFMVYALHRKRIEVLNFAVHPDFRRRDVGRQMVEKLIGKLSDQRRTRLQVAVRETNLSAQLFFQQQDFRAISVLRDFYEDANEAAYLLQYRYRSDRSRTA